ncbi:TPA: restriction endonuclease subunit S [Yersinia enterocolitica]|nr:restriction endonuclease subunit S [Yersinia enterocolitica]EKN4155966.1 restriction endonuclease subunit S [Yersinia enterocolitica]HDL6780908.1 restriction endonuclease subunit S [Yersinia enterocolitica]HDL7741483.1 restriction endonuclease subunit S [Yersinia enterocolitica]HDL8246894.1 restriction endonuclease subunit S [Yersinia enterocolitica]
MSVNNKVPEIRFKGFSGEWKNKKIGRILAEIKRPIELMDNASYQLVTVKRRNEGVVPRVVLKGKNILVKNYFSVKAGDYLISKRQVVHGANGIVPDNLDGAVVSNEYLVVTDSDDITARYWTVISIRPEMHKLFFVSSYGVDIEKLVFDVTDWKNRTIVIPQVTEQKNITDYFQKLDALINQHQQKHDKLSSIKKAMLEKMFPKQGHAIPEIRFKGFSGEWEEKNVDQLGEIITGSTPSTQNSNNYSNDGIPWVTPTDISRNVTFNTAKKLSQTGCKVARIVPKDTILVTCIASIGKNTILGTQGSFNQQINGVVPNEKENDPYFLFSASILWSEKLKRSAASGTMQIVNKTEFSELKTRVPKKEEQTAIGNYFQKLDALINQHQQQIAKLNNIKQACLSKMFV